MECPFMMTLPCSTWIVLGIASICCLQPSAAEHSELFIEVKGHGPALVLIHGGQMDRRMWDDHFDSLAEKYRVIRYDIRGFGLSKAPSRAYSHVDDLDFVLRQSNVKNPILIGLSLGAAISIDYALVHPENVRGLVLVCPGLGGFPFQDRANDLRAVVDAARDDEIARATQLWLENPYMSVAMEQARLRPRLEQLARENVRAWINNPLLLRKLNPSSAERLKEIKRPTFIIGGERDVSDIQKIIEKLSSEIAGAKKVIIPGAGHIVPMETPKVFREHLLSFLAELHPK
jgi:3-oxoadipate enol-lactonase